MHEISIISMCPGQTEMTEDMLVSGPARPQKRGRSPVVLLELQADESIASAQRS